MKPYVVLYRIDSIQSPLDAPFGFVCDAEDTFDAEEKCQDVFPGCDIVWVTIGISYQKALDNYYSFS